MGHRGSASGNLMAEGPEQLLEDQHLPAAMRRTFGDVDIIWVDDADEPNDEDNGGDFRTMPRGDQMTRILVQNRHLAKAIQAERAKGRLPIGILGTCSASLGMVGGIDDDGAGMIWFDAHSDAMTPDNSTNGFFEGMPVTTIAGMCWPVLRRNIPGFHEIPVERIITVGNHEHYWEGGRKDHGDHALGSLVDPPSIAEHGFTGALKNALDVLTAHTDRVYVHIDADVLDPTVLRGNSHCAPGGLTFEQITEALDTIADRAAILAVSLSSYDPAVDPRGPDVLVPLMTHATAAAARSRATTTQTT
jgi:arginase